MQVLARRFYHIPSDPTCVGVQPSIAAMCTHTRIDQRCVRPVPRSLTGTLRRLRRDGCALFRPGRGIDDHTGRTLEGPIGPGPIDQDIEAVAKADQEEQVCGQPCDPARPAPQAHPAKECNRLAAPHGGRMTVVPILEWWRRLARERGKEVASCLPAHPFCRRRHPGHARLVWIEAPELATQGVSSALCQGAAISTPSAPPPITAKESRAARFAGSVSRSADSTASRIRRRSSNASDCLCSTLRLSAPKPCPCCGLLHGQATHAWGSPEAMLHHAGSSRLIPGWVYRSSMRKMQPWSVSERMSRPAA